MQAAVRERLEALSPAGLEAFIEHLRGSMDQLAREGRADEAVFSGAAMALCQALAIRELHDRQLTLPV